MSFKAEGFREDGGEWSRSSKENTYFTSRLGIVDMGEKIATL